MRVDFNPTDIFRLTSSGVITDDTAAEVLFAPNYPTFAVTAFTATAATGTASGTFSFGFTYAAPPIVFAVFRMSTGEVLDPYLNRLLTVNINSGFGGVNPDQEFSIVVSTTAISWTIRNITAGTVMAWLLV